MGARAGRHLEQQAGHEGEADEHDAVLDRSIGLAIGVDRRQQCDAERRFEDGRGRWLAAQAGAVPELAERPAEMRHRPAGAKAVLADGTTPSLPLPARVRLKRTETVSRPFSACAPRLALSAESALPEPGAQSILCPSTSTVAPSIERVSLRQISRRAADQSMRRPSAAIARSSAIWN